ncbi:MAG: response regulator [Opitutaceae bacterium]
MPLPILIAAHDPELRELLAYAFVRSGWTTESAGSGGEALARICGSRPAGVVLDLDLPDIHGVGVMEVIRHLWPEEPVPVIVLCSAESEVHRGEVLRMGADAVVSRPFIVEEIVEALGRLVGKAPGVAGTKPARARRPRRPRGRKRLIEA